MEMDKLQKRKPKKGEESVSEDHAYSNGTALEMPHETEKEKMTNQHTKSFLEKRVEDVQDYLTEHRHHIWKFIKVASAAGCVAVVIAACVLNFSRAVELLALFLVTTFFLAWDWMMKRYGDWLWETLTPIRELLSGNWFWIRRAMYILLLVATVCWLVLDTARLGTRQLMSFFGLLLLVFLTVLFSKYPFRWSCQTLVSGIVLQFLFGVLTLRTAVGLTALEWLGNKTEKFLSFADVGSEFVFGASYRDHLFVFQVMPILVFLSSVISMLYYWGFMQWMICKIGFLMQLTMGTSPVESMAAAGNIFLGEAETALLIRPYISVLTLSEIHAVMTGGFASIAGSILGAYVAYGIEAKHLMTASLMSAPASLAIAKTFWPETEIPVSVTGNDLKLEKGESKSLLDAISDGAMSSAGVVASIVLNIISFVAILTFCDAVLSWLGAMFDCPQLSFGLICSYVFMPLAFMMGVSWEDSFIVAELLGIKTFLNELVAYQKLSVLIMKRKEGGPEYVDNVKQYISVHSETIATYALCGFSNFAALGMSVGALTSLAPHRQSDFSRCGLRALIAGSFSCFMAACIAGLLYVPDSQCPLLLSSHFNNTNVTSSAELLSCCTQLYNGFNMQGSWNETLGEGFTLSGLLICCALAPTPHFNCSSIP